MFRREKTNPFGQGRGLGPGRTQHQQKSGGRMGGPSGTGSDGFCVCFSCGYRQLHTRGRSCNSISCPACGTVLARE